MKHPSELLETTAVGGLVFLIPLVVAGMVLAKALQVAKHLGDALVVGESASRVLLAHLPALLGILPVCLLAGAPAPWSGSVVFMEAGRIQPLDITMPEAVETLRQLGRDSATLSGSIS